MSLSRRRLLAGSGTAAALGLLGAGLTWGELEHRAHTSPAAAGSGVLVLVTLYGGNDGLNTLIPYADNAYHDARPELSYAPDEVIALDERLGLNPALRGLHGLWQRKQLAIVRGVGYPGPDHSHFRSMDIWQTASPAEPVATGWIGRWLDATGDDPVRALHIGPVLPTLALGARAGAAALAADAAPLSPSRLRTLGSLGAADAHDTTGEALAAASYHAEQTVSQTFSTSLRRPAAGAAKPANSLAAQLDLVARCVRAGVPTRVYSVGLGGFDTHADERGTQQQLLGIVDSAITAFLADLAGDARGRAVVLMAYSEFGRRVRANASHGTDHGTAGPVLVAGVPVRGGFYGDEPSLTDLADGDLKATTDFRDIYHELLHRVVDTDPTPSVGQGRRDLGFLTT
jgi:uncharacterized protein (DUF1501 family)